MHKSFLLLSLAAAGWIAGCGSGGGSSSTTTSVRVSDGYVVGATVTAGDTTASEALKKGAGWYQFSSVPQESISVQNGVNDIVTENGIANAGEPYAPLMYAPASYTNITPFTSLLDILGATAMAERYPNAYAYNSTFDFDVVATGKKNFEIAKESRITSYNVCYTKLLRDSTGRKLFLNLRTTGNGTGSQNNTCKSLRILNALVCYDAADAACSDNEYCCHRIVLKMSFQDKNRVTSDRLPPSRTPDRKAPEPCLMPHRHFQRESYQQPP